MMHGYPIKLKEIAALALNDTDIPSSQGVQQRGEILQSQRKQGDSHTTSAVGNNRSKKGINFVSIALACIIMCALSACGKRSSPEPAYTPPPYAPEKPTELNQGD